MTVKYLYEITKGDLPPLAIALGNFDGVHIAHSRLIKKTCELARVLCVAKSEDICPAVFTFTDLKSPYLTTTDEKLAIFDSLGIEYVILSRFDTVKELSPYAFVSDVLRDRLSCAHALCGYNYRFGRGASGDSSSLCEIASSLGITCSVMDEMPGTSSTRIRELLLSGDLENANDLLGKSYSLSGKIIHGRGVGHTFGCPTVNVEIPEGKLLPKNGVYFTLCTIGGSTYRAVTNVGTCPTFGKNSSSCENHLLGVEKDLYGELAKVEFLFFERPEIRFSSPEELYKTVTLDISKARDFFLSQDL